MLRKDPESSAHRDLKTAEKRSRLFRFLAGTLPGKDQLLKNKGIFDGLTLQAQASQPISADAPKLHVSGLFYARQQVVQNGESADGCTGMHKMVKFLARTVPGLWIYLA